MFSGAEKPQTQILHPLHPVARTTVSLETLGTLALFPLGSRTGFWPCSFLLPSFRSNSIAPFSECAWRISWLKSACPLACPHSTLLVSPTAQSETTLGKSACPLSLTGRSHTPCGQGSHSVFSPWWSLKPGEAPGAGSELCGHVGGDMNGYWSQTCSCALGNFCS